MVCLKKQPGLRWKSQIHKGIQNMTMIISMVFFSGHEFFSEFIGEFDQHVMYSLLNL